MFTFNAKTSVVVSKNSSSSDIAYQIGILRNIQCGLR